MREEDSRIIFYNCGTRIPDVITRELFIYKTTVLYVSSRVMIRLAIYSNDLMYLFIYFALK